MPSKKVVVKGGGKNLFKINIYDGQYSVYQIDATFLSNQTNFIGETRSLDDALSLIRSYSGQEIERITDW